MTTEEDAELATRLKAAREFLGLSQNAVADALNIPRASVSLIESAGRKVSSGELRSFARLYRRSPEYLLSGETDVAADDDTIEALFRTTKELTDVDRAQVLNFARFLREAGPHPGTDHDG